MTLSIEETSMEHKRRGLDATFKLQLARTVRGGALKRRLAAILGGDFSGYGRLT